MSSEKSPAPVGSPGIPVPTYLATLELAHDASRVEQQASILRRIAGSDFVPTPVHDLAIGRWQGLDAITDIRHRKSRATNVITNGYDAAVLTEFAQRLFELTPEDRAQRWNEVATTCANHRVLVESLQRLKPHLEISIPDTSDWPPDAAALLQGLLTILVADPMDGAILRRALTLNALSHAHDYQQALKYVRQRAPAVIARHRDLLRLIARGQQARHQRPRPWYPVVYPAPADANSFKKLTTNDPTPVHLPQPPEGSSKSTNPWTWLWLVLVVFGSIVGALDDLGKKTPRKTQQATSAAGPTPTIMTYAIDTQVVFARANNVPHLIDELLTPANTIENVFTAMDDLHELAKAMAARDLEVGTSWRQSAVLELPTIGECYALAMAIGVHAIGRADADEEICRRLQQLSADALATMKSRGTGGWEKSIATINELIARLHDDPLAPPNISDEERADWEQLARGVGRMNELPEDITQWPRDPYQLFQLLPSADAKEIRRVYARLIRRFQPEFHPEHFRRIRGAYDWLLQRATMADAVPSAPSLDPDASSDHINDRQIQADSLSRAPFTDARASLKSLSAHLPSEPATIYRELQDRCRLPACTQEDFAAAYWLVRFYPEYALGQSSAKWLIAGLQHDPTANGLRELFRRHAFWFPDEAISLPIANFIGQHLANPLGQQLLSQRWDAAGWLHRADVIAHDLAQLRGMQGDHHELWTWVLLRAVDELLWCENDDAHRLLGTVHAELQIFASESLTFLDELNGLDYRLELRRDWQRLRESQREEAPLLHALVECSEREDRTGLHYYLVELGTRCRANLAQTLMMLEPCPTISTLILDHLESRVSDWMASIPSLHREITPEHITQIVWISRERLRKRKFRDVRLQIAELSITYGISPRLIITQLVTWNYDQTAVQVLQNDAGLFLAWAACMTPLML